MSVARGFGAGYQALFKKVIRALESEHIPYMIVGGLAATYYGIPRATFDIDLVIAIEQRQLLVLVKTLQRLRFDLKEDVAQLLLKVGNCIPTIHATGLRLDLWLIQREYDKAAFDRRKRCRIELGAIWIASAEDTILSKLIAARTKDFEDALGIVEVQQSQLDWAYIHSWAKRLDIAKQLERVKAKKL